MDMTGDRILPAPRLQVWEALNDPEILRASIPGCRRLEGTSETGFEATADVAIGPIASAFTGQLTLLDVRPPESFKIEGSGQGGAAGTAKGGATVTLADRGESTLLSYAVTTEFGGKLAELDAQLADASAKQMADQFFKNFAAALAARNSTAAESPLSLVTPKTYTANFVRVLGADVLGYPLFAWAAAAVFLFIAFNLFGGYL